MMIGEKSRGPAVAAEPKKWTAAEREEMNRFLGELGGPARSTERQSKVIQGAQRRRSGRGDPLRPHRGQFVLR